MRAILRKRFGGPEVLEIRRDSPWPEPKPRPRCDPGRAFGLNHAELNDAEAVNGPRSRGRQRHRVRRHRQVLPRRRVSSGR